MVTITIQRRAKLEKPMGLGEGRIAEGQIVHNGWQTTQSVDAKDLGLRSITTIHLTAGTVLGVGTPPPCGRVLSPGSPDNSVRIKGPFGSYPLNYIAVGY